MSTYSYDIFDNLSNADSTIPLLGDDNSESSDTITSSTDLDASWQSMPNKGQLAILLLSRFVDFFQMASMHTFMVYQLRSFSEDQDESMITQQAGILQGSCSAAQVVTAVLWGLGADRFGRKPVLLVGLLGAGVSSVGIAFSKSFIQMTLWTLFAGAVNGGAGAAQAMIAENVTTTYHSRAFLIPALAFYMANLLGPVITGLLSPIVEPEPAALNHVPWLGLFSVYPYALPALLSAAMLFLQAAVAAIFLVETLVVSNSFEGTSRHLSGETKTSLPNAGTSLEVPVNDQSKYFYITTESNALSDCSPLPSPLWKCHQARIPPEQPKTPIWMSNIPVILISIAIFDFHIGAFNNLWILFLSAPRTIQSSSFELLSHSASPGQSLLGLGLNFGPYTIGFAMALVGIFGIPCLSLHPWLYSRLGLLQTFRYALAIFPLAYFLAPLISSLPTTSPENEPATGFWIWLGIVVVLGLQVAARTFTLPCTSILIKLASPDPTVLGTLYGLAQGTSSGFRALGPAIAGCLFERAARYGAVAFAFWTIAGISALSS